jgi:hypothetical protein
MTLSITALSIMLLSTVGLIATLRIVFIVKPIGIFFTNINGSRNYERNQAECYMLSVVTLGVVMLSVTILSVVMLRTVMLLLCGHFAVTMLSVVAMLNAVMLIVNMQSVVLLSIANRSELMLRVFNRSVIILNVVAPQRFSDAKC